MLNTFLTSAIIGHGSQPKGEVLADTYRAEQYNSELIADKMPDFVKEKAREKKPFSCITPLWGAPLFHQGSMAVSFNISRKILFHSF